MSRVFGPASLAASGRPDWTRIGLFEPDGRCIAAADVCVTAAIAGSVRHRVGAIRRVAVDEDRRGRGLFLDVMAQAIAWFDVQGTGVVLLYAEHAGLYGRFGFRPVPQHSFRGGTPARIAPIAARRVDIGAEADVVRAMLSARAPVSHQAALLGVDDLFLDHVAATPDLSLVYAETLDALIAFEQEDEGLVVVDVVAATMPSMAEIAGALGARSPTIRTLFAPDLLSWRGDPEPDETGLMARGHLPDAWTRPFMLPPTAEF